MIGESWHGSILPHPIIATDIGPHRHYNYTQVVSVICAEFPFSIRNCYYWRPLKDQAVHIGLASSLVRYSVKRNRFEHSLLRKTIKI
jgi:hypothetical protein